MERNNTIVCCSFSLPFASTAMFYTAVVLWQMDDQPSYRIAVPRSWAPSFVEAFLSGAAEYGVDIKPVLGA